MSIIEVNRLTKEYRPGAMQHLKQELLHIAARLAGKKTEERPLFKALDDVDVKVEEGEVFGPIPSPIFRNCITTPKLKQQGSSK